MPENHVKSTVDATEPKFRRWENHGTVEEPKWWAYFYNRRGQEIVLAGSKNEIEVLIVEAQKALREYPKGAK